MDFQVARRKVNTYGKTARKTRIHDLFDDVEAQPAYNATNMTNLNAPPASTTPSENTDKSNRGGESKNRLKKNPLLERRKQIDSTASSPLLTATDTSETFDFHSSGEEASKAKARLSKKRKIIAPSLSEQGTGSKMASQTTPTPLKQDSSRSSGNMFQTQHHKSHSAKATAANSKFNKTSGVSKRSMKGVNKSPTQRVINTTSMSLAGRLPQTSQPRESRVSSCSSADLSDASSHSQLSQRSTPKRKRNVSDTVSPSLGDLPIKSLRLSPGSGSQRSQVSSEDELMADAPIAPTRKGRARLIDRLDAPRTQSTGHSETFRTVAEVAEVGPPRSIKQPLNDDAPPKIGSPLPKERPALERQSSNVSVAPSGRQRATYGKQRSYLSDMVDNLDGFAGSNSQSSSQQNYTQALSFPNVPSQLEMDLDDSDEPDASSQIKSIHELRRGGAVRQFDLDLQTILEDIESSAKSQRISGLLQLATKLKEGSFLRHFQDSGNFQRLIDCIEHGMNDISATLAALIFQTLSSGETSTPRQLVQVLEALYKVPTHLLSESRPLSKLAKDRNQNISKLMIKDLVEFEDKNLADSASSSRPVSEVVFSAMEAAQRKIIGMKEPMPRLPRNLLDIMLSAFIKAQLGMVGCRENQTFETTRVLLSILEISCANHELSGDLLSPTRLDDLGETIAAVMRGARQCHPELEHSCLRLIVGMSNNDAEVCGTLSQTTLVNTVFQVIDDHFLTLAGLTLLEKNFDHAQLESVILAVGCLLNLAECSDEARIKMLDRDAEGQSLVDKLVGIFNSHADQASKAMTIDQTQILVAFGYISALLCTLCLNPIACKRISKGIKGNSLSQLFGAADTFLHHLQTVEEALEDDGNSSTAFTTRFTTVLDKVKMQTE